MYVYLFVIMASCDMIIDTVVWYVVACHGPWHGMPHWYESVRVQKLIGS